nr:hypothetical protein [Butyrivibrio sp. INlla14]
MVYAMVFGAHLLPYSWLYKSVGYRAFAIIIPIAALVVGCLYPAQIVAIMMLIFEVVFVVVLNLENKALSREAK